MLKSGKELELGIYSSCWGCWAFPVSFHNSRREEKAFVDKTKQIPGKVGAPGRGNISALT